MKIKYQISRMNNTVESVNLIYQVPPKKCKFIKKRKQQILENYTLRNIPVNNRVCIEVLIYMNTFIEEYHIN